MNRSPKRISFIVQFRHCASGFTASVCAPMHIHHYTMTKATENFLIFLWLFCFKVVERLGLPLKMYYMFGITAPAVHTMMNNIECESHNRIYPYLPMPLHFTDTEANRCGCLLSTDRKWYTQYTFRCYLSADRTHILPFPVCCRFFSWNCGNAQCLVV